MQTIKQYKQGHSPTMSVTTYQQAVSIAKAHLLPRAPGMRPILVAAPPAAPDRDSVRLPDYLGMSAQQRLDAAMALYMERFAARGEAYRYYIKNDVILEAEALSMRCEKCRNYINKSPHPNKVVLQASTLDAFARHIGTLHHISRITACDYEKFRKCANAWKIVNGYKVSKIETARRAQERAKKSIRGWETWLQQQTTMGNERITHFREKLRAAEERERKLSE